MARTSSKEKEKEKTSKTKAAPAAGPVAAVTPGGKLGNKRACPKCGTKFYDFCKEELNCPKCNAKLKASQLVTTPNIPRSEPKKSKAPEKVAIETLAKEDGASDAVADAFESVDDLGDDEVVVEEIDVDDDDKKDDY